MSDLVSHITVHVATSATTDEQLLESWLDSLNSPHSRRNFEQTARRFLAELPMGIRAATVEDVRLALVRVSRGLSDASAKQYVLRIKSLLSYGKESASPSSTLAPPSGCNPRATGTMGLRAGS